MAAIPLNLILTGASTILGGIMSGSAQISAGDAQYRIAILNAESLLKTSESNAKLIEASTLENAAIEDFNARMSEAKARDALYRGAEEEKKQRLGIRGLIGSQRASFAAQGLELDLGSALDVQTDTAYQGELDALTIRTNAARESWGFQVEAEGARMQSRALKTIGTLQAANVREVGRVQAMSERMRGEYARSAGRAGGYSTILTTAGKVLNDIYGFNRREES